VANELKEQDYDFMEVLDEQEDLEGQYDDLARDYENAQRVIDEQAKVIEEKEREMADAYAKVKQLEEEVGVKEKIIERINGKFKRGRE
jgi:peptidoglycan hydrolase CwlO-like protein